MTGAQGAADERRTDNRAHLSDPLVTDPGVPRTFLRH
ncbi:hypothetical protein SAMN05216371_7010 [Streptomyces sp. TLI_053]|nr:hypothetical protein SAMN05216371_7010 [Streptomyces sp. TLI_053]